MLTADLKDPDLEAQIAQSFQRRKEFAQDEAKRQAEINDALRQEVEIARVQAVRASLSRHNTCDFISCIFGG